MRKASLVLLLAVLAGGFPPALQADSLTLTTLTPTDFSGLFDVANPVFDITSGFSRIRDEFGMVGVVQYASFQSVDNPNLYAQVFQLRMDLIFSLVPGRGALQELRMGFQGLVPGPGGIEAFLLSPGVVNPFLEPAGPAAPHMVLIEPGPTGGTLRFIFPDANGLSTANPNTLLFGVFSDQPLPTSQFGIIDLRGGEEQVLLTPEPGTLLLLGTGIPLLAGVRRLYQRASRKS
ncbi:MAG: PEP-CTERM sorting domain-containing protein [Terriglobia bacterium]